MAQPAGMGRFFCGSVLYLAGSSHLGAQRHDPSCSFAGSADHGTATGESGIPSHSADLCRAGGSCCGSCPGIGVSAGHAGASGPSSGIFHHTASASASFDTKYSVHHPDAFLDEQGGSCPSCSLASACPDCVLCAAGADGRDLGSLQRCLPDLPPAMVCKTPRSFFPGTRRHVVGCCRDRQFSGLQSRRNG